MKHRRHKVKREHGIIQNALNWLEDLGKNIEVTDIIPGVIEVSRSPERGIVYKYETTTGCKLLLKSNGSIQEAFVVTKDPQWVRKWVEDHFPPVEQVDKPRVPPSKQPKGPRRETKIQEPNFSQTSWSTLGELDDICLGDRLGKDARLALRALQKDLGKASIKITPEFTEKSKVKKKSTKKTFKTT